MGKVYFITDGNYIKIGYTAGSVHRRLNQLKTGSPCQLYLLGYIDGTQKTEHELHIRFGKYRIRTDGEWFEGADEIIEYINAVNQHPNVYVERNAFCNNQIMTLLKVS